MNDKPGIRLVALDLDGTLLNERHAVSPRACAAVRAAVGRGVTVVLVTGRMYRSAQAVARELGLDGVPLIAYNGALTRQVGGPALAEQPLGLSVARAVAAACEEAGYYVQAYVDDDLYIPARNARSREYEERTGIQAREVGPISRWLSRAPHKLLIIDAAPALPAIQAHLLRQFGGRVGIYQSLATYLEVVDPAINKGVALRSLCARLGVAPAEVLAAGDAESDVPMLRLAGIGVAMPGAPAHVRATAAYVPSAPYGDGVAEALERFVLGG